MNVQQLIDATVCKRKLRALRKGVFASATIMLPLLMFFLVQVGVFACPATSSRPAGYPPNVVLIVADDLGYGELGCQGNDEIPTPHVDMLASSGVRCTQAYVTAPNCSPSRAGLLTGKFPTRFGYEFNPIGARNEDPGTGLPSRQLTLSECLHDAGYTTGLVGKWHLGGAPDYHPQRHGFDEFFGFIHEGHYFEPSPWRSTHTMLRKRTLPPGSGQRHHVSNQLLYSSHMGHNEPDYDANNPIIRAGQPVEEAEYLTDAFAREAVDFIGRYRETPFFLTVTFNAVHSPLQAKLSTMEGLRHIEDMHRRIFAGMLVDLDQAVGRILAALESNNLREDTLVIFLSDNGGPTKELTSSNLPLRDGKGSMYEGGLRVPFIFNWPGHLPAGEVCAEVVSSLDIYPTVAKLAKANAPAQLDGQDLLPQLENPQLTSPKAKRSATRELYWRQGKKAALRSGPWKIVAPQRNAKVREWELYNIEADIGEVHNLASTHPDVLAKLKRIWEELDSQMIEPLF